jgi:hypothetical protein
MEIKLKFGIEKLLFGMQQKDVEAIYGKPTFDYKDEEKNTVYVYDALKMRLTFYQDENFKLGYITSTNPNLSLFSNNIIGQNWETIKDLLADNKLVKPEVETVDGVSQFFYEDYWLFLHVEYNEVVKIEVGAVFNRNDEFDWKF